jgi:hypothetical protein
MGDSNPNPVYVDDTLLASSDVNLLYVKKLLSSRLNKNVLSEITLVITIEIHRDRWKGIRIITKACLEKIVKKQSMHASEPTPVHIDKGNNFENFSITRTDMR